MQDPALRPPPALVLEGVENFRDFGRFEGRYGRMTAGMLFRSGHLADATPQDLLTLQALAIATVVDLRRPAERERQPSRRPAHFTGQVIASEQGDRAEAPHVEFLRQGDLSDAGVNRFLLDYYRQAPFEARHLELFAAAFQALGGSEGALLIHCTAGKDRTGLLAALISSALGAEQDDIFADYLETNRVTLTSQRIAQVTPSLRAQIGREPTQAIVTALLGVNARHLCAALEAIDREAGGTEAYLRGLGVGRSQLKRLRARLLV